MVAKIRARDRIPIPPMGARLEHIVVPLVFETLVVVVNISEYD